MGGCARSKSNSRSARDSLLKPISSISVRPCPVGGPQRSSSTGIPYSHQGMPVEDRLHDLEEPGASGGP